MGIRIHKVLGYGMDDIKNSIDDPRFNKDGYLGDGIFEREDKFTDAGFDEHIKKILDSDSNVTFHELTTMSIERRKAREKNTNDTSYNHKDSIHNHITHDDEYGLSNIIVFSPPYWAKNWNRYDDLIDYYDPMHSEPDGSPKNGYYLTNRPIYPFEGYNDCRSVPPTKLNHIEHSVFVSARSAGNDDRPYAQAMIDHAVEKMNFDNHEQMIEMVNPMIPRELVELLKYLKVFNDEADIYRLKPMIYWYWG